jgi:hypothetical protein
MATNRQEEMTPGQTFVDASGRRRWKSRVPGMEDVSEENIETAETLPLASLRSALSEEDTGSGADASSALSKPSAVAQARSAAKNEMLKRTREAETETFPEIRPVFRSPSLSTMPWASETDEQESAAARAAEKTEDQLRRERFLQAYRDTYGLVPPAGHPGLGGVEAPRSADVASPIPFASTPVKADVPEAMKGAIAPTTPTQPAPPAGTSSTVKPPPVEAGSGGDDEMGRLSMGQALVRALEGSGSVISGQNLRSGAADTLGDRMKQIEALRAKKAEKEVTDAQEVANNKAQVDYLISRFPEQTDSLTKLYGMTRKANFPQFVRLEEQIALDRAKKQDIGAKAEDRAATQKYRADTLDLKRDIAKDNRNYRAVQAGLQKAALDLRRAENERKAVGGTEPSTKERGAFQTMMKPAEQTAVALKDADNLNALSTGMLVSGKPPPFLTQSDILSFVGVPPFENAMRSQLAKSNPQAFDLLTQMARLKTMVGHEYFGSALSPAEAERQRQFLDFGVTDTPESVARKMKSYHDSLADKASIFLRPRVVNSPLGAEWTQLSGLDVLSGEGGTFAGLLAAPAPVAPRVVSAAPQPSAIPAPTSPVKTNESAAVAKKPPSARSIEVLKQKPDAMTRQQFDERFGPGAASAALGE